MFCLCSSDIAVLVESKLFTSPLSPERLLYDIEFAACSGIFISESSEAGYCCSGV